MAKILVVDDSETLRSQLKKALEDGGHQVVEGFDGQDGLEDLEKNPDVKLILCDVNMPRMDGLTMIRKVREKDAFKTLPVFMLTTESSPEMKAQGKESGVMAWVVKPFVAEKLLGAISKVVSG